MIAIIATFTIIAEKSAEFEAVAGELVAATNANEPGVKLYTLVRSPSDPAQYRMMELYEDQATVDAHMASDWFKAAGPKFKGLLAGRPGIEQFIVVA